MLIEFLGLFSSMLLFFAPAAIFGVIALFVLEMLFGKLPRLFSLQRRSFSSVRRGAIQGILSSATGVEMENRGEELARKGANADGLCAFQCTKISWSPEGFTGIWTALSPLYALLRGAISLLSAFAVGFFFTPASGMRKLRKTDPEAYSRLREELNEEKRKDKEEKKAAKSTPADAALRAMKASLSMLPGYLLGCAVGAGFATAFPASFFADIDLDGGVLVFLILIAFGFLAGTSGIAMIPVGFGLGLCGMGIGGVFLFLSVAPFFNMTELYRGGKAVGRFKPLVYMAVHTLLCFVISILLDDFVNAGILKANFADIPQNPTEFGGFVFYLICLILFAALCVVALARRKKGEAAAAPKGHLLKLEGNWTAEGLSLLSEKLSEVPQAGAIHCTLDKREVRIEGDASFAELSDACEKAGFRLLMLEE